MYSTATNNCGELVVKLFVCCILMNMSDTHPMDTDTNHLVHA